jgi:hypothetical protein
MAKTEVININGKTELGVNVTDVVGMTGKNRREDIMLLQALFNYIATGLHPRVLGLGGSYNIPDINGEMDADTFLAIGEFQIRNASRLLMHNFDGHIHPASYKNRVIRNIKGHLMSITLLHLLAKDAGVMQGHSDYREGLIKLKPELATYLDRFIVDL